MPDALTPKDLEDYLTQHGIDGKIVKLDMPTPTVEAAAEALGVYPDQIVKSLLFTIEEQAVLVITNGTSRVDRRILGKHFGVNRRKTIFASPDTVLALTGYPVGAVPPLGHRTAIHVLIDSGVLAHDYVYGGGGSDHALMRISPQTIVAHTQAEVLSIQRTEE